MAPTVQGFSLSAQSAANYQRAFPYLRQLLNSHGFEILCEFRVDSDLDRKAGLSWEHLGLPWRHYTVLVVWCPPDVCQALLSDRDGGLLIPFNICVADDGNSTFAAVLNQYGALSPRDGAIGIRLVIRNLTRRIYQVLEEFAKQEETAEHREEEVNETYRL